MVVKHLSLVGLLIAALLGTAGSVRATGVSPTPPTGYKVVHSPLYTINGSSWELGKVICPNGTLPTGGGVSDASYTPYIDVGSSYPSGRSWIVVVNNWGPSALTFKVAAVCLPKLSGYQIVTAAGYATAEATTPGGIQCPGTKGVTGGGVQSAINIFLALNTSAYASNAQYVQNEWSISMSNASSTGGAFTAYGICADLSAPTAVSAVLSMPPGTQQAIHIACPTPDVPLGGGGFAFPQPGAGMVMTYNYPTSNGWTTYFYNGSNYTVNAQAGVLCL